jgi:ATP-dependent Clp protease ATP-binding subunit ClpA
VTEIPIKIPTTNGMNFALNSLGKAKVGMRVLSQLIYSLAFIGVLPFFHISAAEMSAEDRARFRKNQIALFTATSAEEKMKSVVELGKFKVQEAADSLLRVAQDELNAPKPDPKLIIAALQSYQTIAGLDQLATLTRVKDEANRSKTITGRNVMDVSNAFANAIVQIKQNPSLSRLPAEEITDADLEPFNELLSQLRATTRNEHNINLPAIADPKSILGIVEKAEKALKQLGEKNPEGRPTEFRTIVVEALKMLYSGRGETTRGSRDGWNITNANAATSGNPEITTIFAKELLDKKGIEELTEFINGFDINDSNTKKRQGFPPSLEIGSQLKKEEFLNRLHSAKPAEPYHDLGTAEVPYASVADLILRALKQKKIQEDDAKLFFTFIGNVRENFYDESTRIMKTPGAEFVNYFGRDHYVSRVNDIATKTKKGHILLTGKAGVGKTTILKILSDWYVQQKIQLRDEPSPIILELPITLLTNPSDPTALDKTIALAQLFSKGLNRRLFLFVDEAHVSTPMSRNALKGFLTKLIAPLEYTERVHVVFATTTSEAKDFYEDTAFSRRWTILNVHEFNREDTIQLVKQADLPQWRKYHRKAGYEFDDIDSEAYEYGYRYSSLEQPHAGNPTGTEEILEAAIVQKLNSEAGKQKGKFNLSVDDLRNYIKTGLKVELVPGDPEFDAIFNKKWEAFSAEWTGNEGAKIVIRQELYNHFNQLVPRKMLAWAVFGPPGGGKTFLGELIAKHFFNGAKRTVAAAELSGGGIGAMNKLIGAPTGTEGSKEQLGILPKVVADNPHGASVIFEEADYLDQDVVKLLTNTITDRKFSDGRGREIDTSRILFQMNSNIGQEAMVPPDSSLALTWDQYNARRAQFTEKIVVGDKVIEQVRPAKMKAIFEKFIGEIVMSSKSAQDTSQIQQEAAKQMRRYTSIYVLPPNMEELKQGAISKLKSLEEELRIDNGVTLKVSEADLMRIVDLENYQFDKGYSYIAEQMEKKLISSINPYRSKRGSTIQVSVVDKQIEIDQESVPAQDVLVAIDGGQPIVHSLGAVVTGERNPWGSNPDMRKRIRNFSRLMHQHIKGHERVIADVKDLLVRKATDWKTRVNITLLGSAKNGKTEFGKALAKVLFDDEKAAFTVSGLTHEYQVNDLIRPPGGYINANEETEFEKWVQTRRVAGGGVIILKGLLSLSGLGPQQIVDRIGVINKLQSLLAEGVIPIKGDKEDVTGFVIVINGNALSEAFHGLGDDPATEVIVEEQETRISRREIADYLEHMGIDPGKISTFGNMYVVGPLSRSVTLALARSRVEQATGQINAKRARPIQFKIDDLAIQTVVEKLTAAKLGMSELVRGLDGLILAPISGIIEEIPSVKTVEAKMDPETKIVKWIANGKEVVKEGVKISDRLSENNWVYRDEMQPAAEDKTPQIKTLSPVEKMKYTDETLNTVLVHEYAGHWMAEVLLERKNGARIITLFPGVGYLGAVYQKQDEVFSISTVSNLFRKMIMLDAGHRAVFQAGFYATGGGNDGSTRSPQSPPSDDLGKIEKTIDLMINNNILPDLRESSSPASKTAARNIIREYVDIVTDLVLKAGIESKIFDPYIATLRVKRYYDEPEMDKIVSELDFSSFGSKDEFLLKMLVGGTEKYLQMHPENKVRTQKFLSEIVSRVATELRTRNVGDSNAVQKLKDVMSTSAACRNALTVVGQ